MRNKYVKGFLFFILISCFIPLNVNAEDLIFDSFEEAEKAAEQRAAEYDKRMKEQMASVDKAWEKQKADLGEGANYDVSKITETRETEQTSENEDNKKLQDSVTESINGLKQQMVNSINGNTVGFAGASAAYSWSVKYKDGKYVLSDTYDQAFFVSGASKNQTTTTTSPDNPQTGEQNSQGNSSETAVQEKEEKPSESQDEPISDEKNTAEDEAEEIPPSEVEQAPQNEVVIEEANPVNTSNVTKADRVVEITIQHPTTFEEATFAVTENQTASVLKLDKFSIPEDTRVRISAKANKEIENTTLTMTVVDDEGESDPIDAKSMKNHRHLFRIPSPDAYSVNIYVNEEGKSPRKIMQLCIPVVAVDFETRTIGN